MYKFVTLYRRVDDQDALERFFSETHLPLSETIPGLIKSEVSRIDAKPGGRSRFHLMYELYFADADAFHQAMLSEEGMKLFNALIPWTEAKVVTWFDGETWEEMRKADAGSIVADAGDESTEGQGDVD